jgi:hypothetical protein
MSSRTAKRIKVVVQGPDGRVHPLVQNVAYCEEMMTKREHADTVCSEIERRVVTCAPGVELWEVPGREVLRNVQLK